MMSVPNPDPTSLTTDQLHREIAGLRELMDTRVDEGFQRLEQRFSLVEQWRVEQKADTKEAVQSALTAQKEAVQLQTEASERAIAKSEAATTKQLEQLATTFATAFDGVRRDIDGVKERINNVDRRSIGMEGEATGATAARLGIYAFAGFLVSIIVIGGFVMALAK